MEDFTSILKALSKQSESVVLVGGHAVNVWALSYQTESNRKQSEHAFSRWGDSTSRGAPWSTG